MYASFSIPVLWLAEGRGLYANWIPLPKYYECDVIADGNTRTWPHGPGKVNKMQTSQHGRQEVDAYEVFTKNKTQERTYRSHQQQQISTQHPNSWNITPKKFFFFLGSYFICLDAVLISVAVGDFCKSFLVWFFSLIPLWHRPPVGHIIMFESCALSSTTTWSPSGVSVSYDVIFGTLR